MSQVSTQSPKHCANKGLNFNKLYKRLFFASSALFTSVLSLVLLIWLILRPTKPEFSIKQFDIYQLNLSAPNLLNSSIQVSLQSRNANQKVGVYYDDFQVYAVYKSQQITTYTSLPPFYQGHEETNILTASLIGTGLPVAPSFGYEVGRDQAAGRLVINLKANGRLRWKVGTWVSGRYRFAVSCAAVLPFGPNIPAAPLSSKQGTECSTTV
ncbi:hypothetical protein K2173_021846 [Erythroxylum novogranatense]|uniref:Late embryogenesis abundant protein LEA-2 subgroup domain-containing protein n=1 Tax=Erythroxylum novogranatense TaxID=1862640 RepID=A0AAV8T3K3_9ROSI|nr:hypothetical protein K2173_021846 [Erythroxylum novogranatense]